VAVVLLTCRPPVELPTLASPDYGQVSHPLPSAQILNLVSGSLATNIVSLLPNVGAIL